MNKAKKRWEKSLKFKGTVIISVLGLFLLEAGQGGAATPSRIPASYPDRSIKAAAKVAPIHRSSFSGRPDPFQPFLEREIGRKKLRVKRQTRPLSIFPLQRADVGQFRLVGIAGNEQERRAIVTDASGKFFPVGMGTTIGVNRGRVTQILEDRVIVEERVTSGKGQYKTRFISLKLQKADE